MGVAELHGECKQSPFSADSSRKQIKMTQQVVALITGMSEARTVQSGVVGTETRDVAPLKCARKT